ncbi:TonB-dependent siderophore receptor [Hymenobacter sp. BT186]|uniref:TonB-dependent siderophore receptor n=1 Tax=Hymenobacter telluris TaxID=2816474 RepID=A0A939JAH0_9BACT|nr:TonB-dependent receptor [Hymenobacter telluris]MBO0358091.1 TonB-dependent siderophore receptor [Hymenobacter telluris]MBW3374118.1 TonB-dependent receptor [Hymenobacter norwichensis]
MHRLLMCLLLLWPLLGAGQSAMGHLDGHVNGPGGHGLEGVSILETTGRFSALSGSDGHFSLALPLGEYTLVTRSLSHQEQRRTVVLSAETPNLSVDFTLQPVTNSLQEVEVLGRKETTYKSDYSFVGTKTATAAIDVPQSISTVTKELMEDRQALRLTEVVKNVAGVTQYSHYDDLTIRGFRNGYESGFRLLNGLRSGFSYGNSFTQAPLTVNLERVEVLKGPGAALYGDINPGGTVNMVTKKPLDVARQAVTFSTGSFNTMRTTADLTGPLSEQKNVLYRFNAGFEKTNTFRAGNDTRSLMVAPTVTFLPTDKTTINAEAVYTHIDGYLDRGLPIRGGDLYALPRSFTLSQPSDYFRTSTYYFNASLNHKFTEWLSFNASYLDFTYHEDLSEHRTLNTYADAPANTVMNLRYFDRRAEEYTKNLASYFVLNVATGPVTHKVVAGVDYIRYNTDPQSTMFEARQKLVNGVTSPLTFDLKNPVYEIQDPTKYLRRPLPQFFVDYINSVYHTTGLYVQDQLDVTARLGLLLGARYELFTDERDYGNGSQNIRQSRLLPRAGLTYALRDNLNYFVSYSAGFRPLKPEYIRFPERYGRSAAFDPETSYQLETGLKGEFFNKGLLGTVAVYQIVKRNQLVNTGSLTPDGAPVYRQNGQARSRGAELELVGNISTTLSVNANYAFNHSEVLEADLAVENGQPLANAPKHSAGLWTKYTFVTPALRGLGVAVGGNAVGRRRTENQVVNTTTGELYWAYWPSYTTLDAALFYTTGKFNFHVNVNNLLDKYYFVGGYDFFRASPGAPRNYMATLGYTF